MESREFESWMWSEARVMLDRAERLQRQFFRPCAKPQPQWEPPADVFETRDAIWVIFVLPGVSETDLTIQIQDDTLTVSGERRIPTPGRDGILHRLEIPHGRFERRLHLPFPRIQVTRRNLLDGCLYLQLRKTRVPL